MIEQLAINHIDRTRFPSNTSKSYIMERGKYTKMAYGLLQKNWLNAEDCVQEAFIKALQYMPEELSEEELEKYFSIIVQNTAYNFLRNTKQRELSMNNKEEQWLTYLEISIDEDEEEDRNELIALAERDTDPAEVALGNELRIRIEEEIDKMPRQYRGSVALYVIYGYKPRDISIITGESIKKVYNSIQHFRNRMQGELE